ncbi:MAG: transposase [Dehalococcoidia bacterium]|nr:transposase [Dehalococcoidia bacterium]
MCVKRRKKIRLSPEIYRIVGIPCSITIATKGKQKIFSEQHLALSFVALLKRACEGNDILLYAYCVMPDHVHLLISASERKGIIEFVRGIKSLSTKMAWQHGYSGTIWQRSFYDHFLRKDEDCRIVADYIVHNPVRDGIVEDWKDYRFSGSLVYEL